MVLRTYKGYFTDVSLNNNTPVNTEVLWGGGLWWGLWAGPGDVHPVVCVIPVWQYWYCLL
jgi:hypothetical protein